jgi:hypothetical protein
MNRFRLRHLHRLPAVWLVDPLILLGLIPLLFFSCTVPKAVTKSQPVEVSFCPVGTAEKTQSRVGQQHRWCEDASGLLHGPFQVSYANGRQKAAFNLNRGHLEGAYIGWHSNNKWAIKQVFSRGVQQGATDYRPPYGPPSNCQPGECAGMDATLTRPYCLPEEISAVFKANKPNLTQCLSGGNAAGPITFSARWSIDLTGRPSVVQIRTSAVVSSQTIECLRKQIVQFRYPTPLGQTCKVKMDFELNFD